MKFKEYTATPEAVEQARACGLYGETEKRLRRMARRAAPVTHEQGNRRFLDFILSIQGSTVLSIARL